MRALGIIDIESRNGAKIRSRMKADSSAKARCITEVGGGAKACNIARTGNGAKNDSSAKTDGSASACSVAKKSCGTEACGGAKACAAIKTRNELRRGRGRKAHTDKKASSFISLLLAMLLMSFSFPSLAYAEAVSSVLGMQTSEVNLQTALASDMQTSEVGLQAASASTASAQAASGEQATSPSSDQTASGTQASSTYDAALDLESDASIGAESDADPGGATDPEPTPTPDPDPTPTPTPPPAPDPDPEPTPPPSPSRIQITKLLLKWNADYGGENEFVGKGEPIETIEIIKKGQLVQLNTYYLDNTGSGVLEQTASSSTQLGFVAINWSSSDLAVATVDPLSGLVTPRGNGRVTIKAEVADPSRYGAATAEVNMIIDGQDGEYVSSVEITDEAGAVINETVQILPDGNKPAYYQLYARITWVDANGNQTRVEWTGDTAVSTTVTWETSGHSTAIYVNQQTGRVATQEEGIGSVTVNVEGGLGGHAVSDTVFFFVGGGQGGYEPQNHLTLNFCYQDYPNQIAQSIRWSVDELASLLSQDTYDYTVSGGSFWGTIRATGYKFLDIINLANQQLHVYTDFDDIQQFSFGTADSYDSPVSASYLFGSSRYYFPNYDAGSTNGAKVVPPMLASASNFYKNQSYVNPNDELSIGTRFRLVFGISGRNDTNTSKQIYYINTIKIMIKGSPPSTFGGVTNGGEGNGTGTGSGDGFGSGDGMGTGGGNSAGSVNSGGQSGIAGGASGGSGGTDAGVRMAEGLFGLGGPEYRYYMTMIDANTDLGFEMDNPLAPFAMPASLAAVVGGGLSMFVGYRRRLY